MSLHVSEGKYSREFKGIYFPAGKKTFSVRAENIKDIRVSLGPLFFMTFEYPLDGPRKATKGIATISISLPVKGIDVAGKKNVRVYGAALDDATSVILTTDMAIKVTADKKGDFKLDLDTGGVPLGVAPTPSSSQKSSIGTTSSPSQKQTQTPEPTLGQEQTSTPESTPDQKQTATPEPSPSPPSRLIPGFNAFFAIAGLFTVAYLVLALRRK
jgi:hypothetical protein